MFQNVNYRSQIDTYFNIAGCIPGVKEVSGLARAGMGCLSLARGALGWFLDRTESPSLAAYVIHNEDPYKLKIQEFIKKHPTFKPKQLIKELPEIENYMNCSQEQFYNRNDMCNGCTDIGRAVLESALVRSVFRTSPLRIQNCSMQTIRDIGKNIFNPSNMKRSVPFCAAMLAANMFVPAEPFAPVLHSRVMNLNGSTLIESPGTDDTTIYYVGRLIKSVTVTLGPASR